MEQNICIFGASSTWGAWDKEKGGWVNRLRLFIDSQDKDMFVYNLGVSGDTTRELLARFDVEAEARQPAVIIFSIGDNDSIFIKSQNRQMVAAEEFEKNIQQLIDKSKKFTDKIVFCGCKKVDESKAAPIPWETDYHYFNKHLSLYNQKLKELSEKNQVYFLEIFDLLTIDDLDDGLHSNSQGHKKIFLAIKSFLQKNRLL